MPVAALRDAPSCRRAASARARSVAAGAERTVTFAVSAADLAEVDEHTGDLVSEAAGYTLTDAELALLMKPPPQQEVASLQTTEAPD